jgi:hypothetical protein
MCPVAATFVDVTADAASDRMVTRCEWRLCAPRIIARRVVSRGGEETRRDLLYASDPVVEYFYEHLLPVPEWWAEYRFALRPIMFSGRLPSGDRLEQPQLPTFSFKRDAVHAAQRLPAYLPPETRRLLARGRAREPSGSAV